MDGLWATGWPGVPGVALPVSLARILGHLERAAHAAAGKAQRSEQQERGHNAKLQTAVHLS